MITLFCSRRCTCNCISSFLPLNYLKVAFWSSRFVQNSASWQSSQVQLLSSFLLFSATRWDISSVERLAKLIFLLAAFFFERFGTNWPQTTEVILLVQIFGTGMWKKIHHATAAQANDKWWHETWDYVN